MKDDDVNDQFEIMEKWNERFQRNDEEVSKEKKANDYNVWYDDAADYLNDVINNLKNRQKLGLGQNAIDFHGSWSTLSAK